MTMKRVHHFCPIVLCACLTLLVACGTTTGSEGPGAGADAAGADALAADADGGTGDAAATDATVVDGLAGEDGVPHDAEADTADAGDAAADDLATEDAVAADVAPDDADLGDAAQDVADTGLVDVDALDDTQGLVDVPVVTDVPVLTDVPTLPDVPVEADVPVATDAATPDAPEPGTDAWVDDVALTDAATDGPDATAIDDAGTDDAGAGDTLAPDVAADVPVDVYVNQAPAGVPVVAIAPLVPVVGQDLVASVVTPSVDPEGQPLTWTWAWSLDGQPTTFVGPVVPGAWVSKNHTWQVTAVASDGELSGPAGVAAVTVVNSAPTPVVLAEAPTTVPLTGKAQVTVLTDASDADGDQIQVSFAWLWNGKVIAGGVVLDVPNTLPGGQHLGVGTLELDVTVIDSEGAKVVTKKFVDIVASPVCGTPWGQCGAHASCTDNGTLSPSCGCDPGWSGDGVTCTDVDECKAATAKCAANATCSNTPGSYDCTCNAGYEGTGFSCQNIDECKTGLANCDINATCQDTVGSFVCTCNAGWEGTGTVCTDVDECASAGLNQCDVHAQCINQDGGYDCQCVKGWTGSGLACTDVDECAQVPSVCDAHATCTNTDGSHTCQCNPGWTGNGNKTCTDVNECTAGTALCDVNATCGNIDGAYTCACKAGYVGDGKTCLPACTAYCNDVMANCTGGNAQYADLNTCLQTCTTWAAWPLGTSADLNVDTVACRASFATGAAVSPAVFCPAAGPIGGGVCGSNCDAFCDLVTHTCASDWPDAASCKTTCGGWKTTGTAGDTAGNTWQCHMTYALTAGQNASACASAGTAGTKCVDGVDLGGWKVEQTTSTQSYTIPAKTFVPYGGYLILARFASKAQFELFWGVTLGPNVVFLTTNSDLNGNTAVPVINGDETFTLRRPDTTVADGPTWPMPTSAHQIFARTFPGSSASLQGAWTATLDSTLTNATPGAGQKSGVVSGPYISEFADVPAGTGNFANEYVEIFLDPGL